MTFTQKWYDAVINGNQPGGTSLGLLKAMGYGTCVLTLNSEDNAETVQDSALLFDLSAEDLRAKMTYALDHPERVEKLRGLALDRCSKYYSWDRQAEQYEAVLMTAAQSERIRTT